MIAGGVAIALGLVLYMFIGSDAEKVEKESSSDAKKDDATRNGETNDGK